MRRKYHVYLIQHKELPEVKYIDLSVATKYNRWKGIEFALREWLIHRPEISSPNNRSSKHPLYLMLGKYGIREFTISPLQSYHLPDRGTAMEYVHKWAAELNAICDDNIR
jgi:hypothetical protein